MKSVSGNINININTVCPYCNKNVDLVDKLTDSNLYNVVYIVKNCNKYHNIKVECNHCNHTFMLEKIEAIV